MAKRRIDEGLMKYIIKLFFPDLEREVLNYPAVQRDLRDIAKLTAEYNEILARMEKRTGRDFSDLNIKRK